MSDLLDQLHQIKNKSIYIRATKREFDVLDRYCKAMKLSKSVAIRMKIISQLEKELSELILDVESEAKDKATYSSRLKISSALP